MAQTTAGRCQPGQEKRRAMTGHGVCSGSLIRKHHRASRGIHGKSSMPPGPLKTVGMWRRRSHEIALMRVQKSDGVPKFPASGMTSD
jgi:hypothetical protein